MSTADRLLPRLQGVRQLATSRWVAKCPAHDDRSPSLSIRETEDGRLLLHDFGGCSTHDVLAALGMTAVDLFPERITHRNKPMRPNHCHAARAALKTMHVEGLVVLVAAERVASGIPLAETDRDRLAQAVGRLRAAVEACA